VPVLQRVARSHGRARERLRPLAGSSLIDLRAFGIKTRMTHRPASSSTFRSLLIASALGALAVPA
jgi:hypothetical protein